MSKTVFRVEIELGNDAMRTTGDVWRALRNLQPKLKAIADNGVERKIMDENGNSVGTVGFYLEPSK